MAINHLNEESARETALGALQEAKAPWIAVVANIEDGKLVMRRTTWEFPRDKLLEVSTMLRTDVERELNNATLSNDPLPEAEPKIVSVDEGEL